MSEGLHLVRDDAEPPTALLQRTEHFFDARVEFRAREARVAVVAQKAFSTVRKGGIVAFDPVGGAKEARCPLARVDPDRFVGNGRETFVAARFVDGRHEVGGRIHERAVQIKEKGGGFVGHDVWNDSLTPGGNRRTWASVVEIGTGGGGYEKAPDETGAFDQISVIGIIPQDGYPRLRPPRGGSEPGTG